MDRSDSLSPLPLHPNVAQVVAIFDVGYISDGETQPRTQPLTPIAEPELLLGVELSLL